MSQENCTNCKRAKEHVATVLAFQVLEKITDKPLRIRGIAMCSGMSRNHNIYTSEELQAFANKLTNAPVYIEHVAVPNAIGKVTKTEWDGHNLWYEAEIYDEQTAEKISKGLIQHVSVGADYEAVDLVDGKIPHGLHNAELSLVAVPGIPQTNVQVLEGLQKNKPLKETLTQIQSKLIEMRKTVEELHKQLVEGSLLKNPPKMMPVSEHIAILERLLRSLIFERSNLGKQRQAELIRAALFMAKELLSGAPSKMMTVSEHIAILERLLPPLIVERSTLGMQQHAQLIKAAIYTAKQRLSGAA